MITDDPPRALARERKVYKDHLVPMAPLQECSPLLLQSALFPRSDLPDLNIIRTPSSSAIFAPIQQVISTAIAVKVAYIDTKNATLCWKTRACTKLKTNAEDIRRTFSTCFYLWKTTVV